MEWFSQTYRKVLFDFHTGTCAGKLLENFDAEALVAGLQDAGVQAISICAKDHHGHSYYPTQVGFRYPGLERDMIGEFTIAAKAAGMRVVTYLSVGWDNWAFEAHPEWRQQYASGDPVPSPSLTISEYVVQAKGRWQAVCHNTGYGDYVVAQVEELFANYPVDGLWLDILGYAGGSCYCPTCRTRYALSEYPREIGLTPEQQEKLRFARWQTQNRADFIARLCAVADRLRPHALVMDSDFVADEAHHPAYTYTSYQSRWGATVPAPTPYELVTHRFFSMWGEWTIKPALQIKHEVLSIAVNGSMPHLGDQMYPDGTLDNAVLDTIGEAFDYVAEREESLQDLAPGHDVAILDKRDMREVYQSSGEQPLNEMMGMTRLLLEGHRHVGFLKNLDVDLSIYSVVVLPDQAYISPDEAQHLSDYVRRGGILLVDGRTSLFNEAFEQQPNYALSDLLGIDWVGMSPYSVNYFRATGGVGAGIPDTSILVRDRVHLINPREGTATLATVTFPLVETTDKAFISHQHAPPAQATHHPFLTARPHGKGIAFYLASQAGRHFWLSGCPWLKRLVLNALHEVAPDTRPVKLEAPISVELTLKENDDYLAVHLLDYHGERPFCKMWSPSMRAAFIEEMPDRTGLTLTARGSFEKAFLIPGRQELEMERRGESVRVRVPHLHLHAAVLLEKTPVAPSLHLVPAIAASNGHDNGTVAE